MHAFEDYKGMFGGSRPLRARDPSFLTLVAARSRQLIGIPLGLLGLEYRNSSQIARLVCCTTLVLLVTLILVGGYACLDNQALFGRQSLPLNCWLAVEYWLLPAPGHEPPRAVAPIIQRVARLERMVGRCVIRR
jgi:hypothetical protein